MKDRIYATTQKVFLIYAIVAATFYLFTGLVFVEGGFDFSLALKPYPMWGWFFGGGEEGVWARMNPDAEIPWWQNKELFVLYADHWEYGYPLWSSLYVYGLLTVPIAVVIGSLCFLVRLILRAYGGYNASHL